MKHLFLFLLFTSISFGQTKQQLMDGIVKDNTVWDRFSCAYYYTGCPESQQYIDFEKLKAMMTEQELTKLTNDKNPVLRMLAIRELINAGKGNPAQFYSRELKKKQSVMLAPYCDYSLVPTTEVVYYLYEEKLLAELGIPDNYKASGEAMQKALATDSKMMELDSVVLYSENAEILRYRIMFGNRQVAEKHLPQVEKLAFKLHNSHALEHLQEHYGEEYKERIAYYWKNEFPRAKFKGGEALNYYMLAIELLLKTQDEHLKNIALDKLKKDRMWEKNNLQWVKDIFKKYGYSFEDFKQE